ncbi:MULTISPECIES: hypothetical protein [Streptosporangium]|uniref:Uncharacterized protein n=1 Tax=Streptosporangium brasiliense TaxID=47480 RepID=A0ABT9R403_9ACTN|nr:hypothetical protein [Streptosporangium brasiliense]MDP9863966.1 hypothetical protein [Streptosporangium brasiliense]
MADHDVDDVGGDERQQPGGAVLDQEGEDPDEKLEAVFLEEVGECADGMLAPVTGIESADRRSPKSR